jgi:hypothetical protein
MAYNVSNWGTVAADATIGVGFVFTGGSNEGAQFAQGNPEYRGACLRSDEFAIEMNENGETVYEITLSNLSDMPTWYALDGGGV